MPTSDYICSVTKPLFLIVDADAYSEHPQLPFLCDFHGVNEVRVEADIRIEDDERGSRALIGDSAVHALRPLRQFRGFAQKVANGDAALESDFARVMALSYLAEQRGADYVVTSVELPESEASLFKVRRISMDEALSVIGAHVRQHDDVALAGNPPLREPRTFVCPFTARVVVPGGQRFFEWCHSQGSMRGESFTGYAEAVFKRLGQALRARDAVHEALRRADGPAQILDALYHLDAVFTSSVGALDSLGKVANDVLGLGLSGPSVAWQREKFFKKLKERAPQIADLISERSTLGVQLRLVTTARNTIHGIPLDEYLKVDITSSTVEHRVMVFTDAADALRGIDGVTPKVLQQFGLHLDAGSSDVNVGRFVEETRLRRSGSSVRSPWRFSTSSPSRWRPPCSMPAPTSTLRSSANAAKRSHKSARTPAGVNAVYRRGTRFASTRSRWFIALGSGSSSSAPRARLPMWRPRTMRRQPRSELPARGVTSERR